MLRFVVLLAALALVQGVYVPQEELIDERASRVFENVIEDAVACLKENLNQGIPELGLPSFNPLKLDEFNLNLSIANNPLIKGSLRASNLLLEGVTDINLDRIKGSITIIPPSYTLEYAVSNPSFKMSAAYEIDAHVFGTDIFGKGNVQFEVNDAYASGDIKLTVLGGIEIKEFNIEIGLKKANLKITGLMNDEELSSQLSEFVTSSLPSLLEENKATISEEIKKLVMENAGSDGGTGNEKLDKIINTLKELCVKVV